MKTLTTILFVLISVVIFGQDSISLKKYCPTQLGQEGALCFAYAPVYTALSIEHNVTNNQINEKSPGFKVFSYGFVASKVKKDKSFLKKLFNRCGRNGTADLALDVLLKTGTVEYKDFPEKCDCEKVDNLISKAEKYKIQKVVNISGESITKVAHIKGIKDALIRRKPVIITIFQETFFYKNNNEIMNFPRDYAEHQQPANHVVCIVGFSDFINGGSFLIKNNYTSWGKQGFSYVKYNDMLKLIRESYTIDI